MPQLFRDTEYNERFDRWTARVKNLQQAMGWRFFDEIITSKTMGYFIWDNNLSDLVPFFGREYFANNFTSIIAALGVAGTFEAYIAIITSAIGSGTEVTFESPKPSHLIITINADTTKSTAGAYHEDALQTLIPDQNQYPDTEMIFSVTQSQLTINETEKLIELLNVNGVVVEINFTT